MSGFDDSWLALREPADHAARNTLVAKAVHAHFAGRGTVTVVDLGCGSGSNLRALAGLLPAEQTWHLIDDDPALLAAARRRLGEWADRVVEHGDQIELEQAGRRIRIIMRRCNLAAEPLPIAELRPDLVTAAALLDLVSASWLTALARAVAEADAAFLAALNYDGAASWSPGEALDDTVISAFNRHQRRDKGFGPALGPTSGPMAMRLFGQFGYRTVSGDSPWQLGADQRALMAELSRGFATAAAEMEPDCADALQAWADRRTRADGCTVGHSDVLAIR